MSLDQRLRRLEEPPAAASEMDLRATVDALAREHDLPFEELLEETQRILAMTPAQRRAYGAELRAEIVARGEPTDELDALIRDLA